MKKLSKVILAVILTCSLSFSPAIVSFAGDSDDPGGKCHIAVPYYTLYNISNEDIQYK